VTWLSAFDSGGDVVRTVGRDWGAMSAGFPAALPVGWRPAEVVGQVDGVLGGSLVEFGQRRGEQAECARHAHEVAIDGLV
jgi:hypothetical protein